MIAAVKAGSVRAISGLGQAIKLYDYGDELSYVHYAVGCSRARGLWLAEDAAKVATIFKQAGVKAPVIRRRRFFGRFVTPVAPNAPQADAAPVQRIG
ncbi:MAG: hypothetical protein EBQ96_01015 [Proteobacteria bacterium]|nr:hypothetical protein [Pseudomonadota bacterium]